MTGQSTDMKTVYPLISGSITGPALSGTILHGVASPEVTDDGQYAYSIRGYYGNTTDGQDFFIEQKGVGLYTREQTWLVFFSLCKPAVLVTERDYLEHQHWWRLRVSPARLYFGAKQRRSEGS